MEKDTRLDLISIIVPVYNTGQRLRACLDSILKQTYPAWELIIVDDGSDDNSPEICDSYKEIDERVKVLHTRNSGVGQARNHGMAIATGAWRKEESNWLKVFSSIKTFPIAFYRTT